MNSSPAYRCYLVVVLTLLFCVAYVDRALLNLLVEPVKADLGLSDIEISLLQGFAFVLFYVAMGIPLARLADAWSRRGVIVIGVIGWSVMTALCGFSRTFWHMALARIGVGIGEAGLTPASHSVLCNEFPGSRAAAPLAIYTAGIYIGGGGALVMGAIGLDWAQGIVQQLTGLEVAPWRAVFILAGIAGLVFSLLALTIREPPRQDHSSSVHGAPSLRDVLRHVGSERRSIGGVTLAVSLLVVTNASQLAWVPSFLVRVGEWTITEAGYRFGFVLMLSGCAGVAVSTLALRRIGSHSAQTVARVAAGSAALLTVPAILAPLVADPVIGLALFGLSIFFYSFPLAAAPFLIQYMTPDRMRARVSALYLLAASVIGLGFGPLYTALFTELVFGGGQTLGLAIAATAATTTPLAVALFWRASLAYPNRTKEDSNSAEILSG